MKQPFRCGLRSTRRATIAGRARRGVACARAEWAALAVRLGIESARSAVDASELRRAKLARIAQDCACGAYQIDAQVIAARLIERLLTQTRLPHC